MSTTEVVKGRACTHVMRGGIGSRQRLREAFKAGARREAVWGNMLCFASIIIIYVNIMLVKQRKA